MEVNGQGIEDVLGELLLHLGVTVSKEGGGTQDIHNRVVKARGVFLRLKKIWSSNSINRRTKVMLYKTAVKPVLIYGCETWKMNKSDENKIDVFQSSGPFLETTDNFPGPVSIFSSSFICHLMVIIGTNLATSFTKLERLKFSFKN